LFPKLKIVASEVEPQAIRIAMKNAFLVLGAESMKRLKVIQSDSQTEVLGVFAQKAADFIISNPPYLDSSDPIDPDVLLYEPRAALFAASPDSLYFYREFASHASQWLKPGGYLFLEVPHQRAQLISELFDKKIWKIRLAQDLTGRDRVLVAILNP
ncbi:MAG: hypothetical protein AABZ55_15885, partial [Bdellovibrionota bacterium]